MTAQVTNRLLFEEDDYSILRLSTPLCFDPGDYGITPVAVCSACWAGYWCVYSISEKGIFVRDLYIHSADERYPAINGVLPLQDPMRPDAFSYMGHLLYSGVDIPVAYTGKMLIGKDYDYDYRPDYEFTPIVVSYGTVRELLFEDGKLADTMDHSKTVKALRLSGDRKETFWWI